MKKLFKQKIKFKSSKYFFFFLFSMTAAYLIHKVFNINVKSDINAILSGFGILANILFLIYLNSILGKLEEQHPVQYKYLPERYRTLSNINGWIIISLLLLVAFINLEWFDSIMVIMTYWCVDFFYRKHQIRKATELTNRVVIVECLNIYLGLHKKRKTADLKFLLSRGLRDEINMYQVIQMFSNFFWFSLKEDVRQIIGNQKEWELTYREIYYAANEWIAQICDTHTEDNIELEKLWVPFIKNLETLLREDAECDIYVAQTILSAILSFAMSNVSHRQQNQFFVEFSRIVEKEGFAEDNRLRNILFLFLEFTFQYHEEKESNKISLDRDIIFLYKYSLRLLDKKDVDFCYFIWLLWVHQLNQTLSTAIISFEELMQYCIFENGMMNGSERNSNKYDMLKTKSLYVLIREMQPEQEMIL